MRLSKLHSDEIVFENYSDKQINEDVEKKDNSKVMMTSSSGLIASPNTNNSNTNNVESINVPDKSSNAENIKESLVDSNLSSKTNFGDPKKVDFVENTKEELKRKNEVMVGGIGNLKLNTFSSPSKPSNLHEELLSRSPSRFAFSDELNKSKKGIEEIILNPGTFRVLRVWFTPKQIYNLDTKAAKLQKRKFPIQLTVRDFQGVEIDQKTINCQVGKRMKPIVKIQ